MSHPLRNVMFLKDPKTGKMGSVDITPVRFGTNDNTHPYFLKDPSVRKQEHRNKIASVQADIDNIDRQIQEMGGTYYVQNAPYGNPDDSNENDYPQFIPEDQRIIDKISSGQNTPSEVLTNPEFTPSDADIFNQILESASTTSSLGQALKDKKWTTVGGSHTSRPFFRWLQGDTAKKDWETDSEYFEGFHDVDRETYPRQMNCIEGTCFDRIQDRDLTKSQLLKTIEGDPDNNVAGMEYSEALLHHLDPQSNRHVHSFEDAKKGNMQFDPNTIFFADDDNPSNHVFTGRRNNQVRSLWNQKGNENFPGDFKKLSLSDVLNQYEQKAPTEEFPVPQNIRYNTQFVRR